MKSLAIIATHPIQYYVPIYRELVKRGKMDVQVVYHEIPDAQRQGVQFGVPFEWDVDLRSGYPSWVGTEGVKEFDLGVLSGRWSAVLVHGWHHAIYRHAIWRAWKSSLPVMVRGDSHLKTPRPWWKRFLKYPIYRALLPRFSACLAVGEGNADYYRHYGVAGKKIFRSPHCVDNDRFKLKSMESLPKRNEMRRSWGVEEGAFVFLFAGRLVASKRIGDLFQALARIRKNCPKACAVVVGEGPLRGTLESQARELGVRVVFTGFQNQTQIVSSYVSADCLVLPSDGNETWGLVVNEALACGCPALVSDDTGCAQDMIKANVNGSVYPCGMIGKMSEAMSLIAEGKTCFSRNILWDDVLQKHSCEAAAAGIEQALEGVRKP